MKVGVTKEQLYNLYWEKMWTMMQIAKYFGCSYPTIRNKMLKYEISIRTISEANKGRSGNKGSKNPFYGRYHTEETKKKIKQNHMPPEEQWNYNPEKHKKYYCIEPDCDNKICYRNWKSGSKRCHSCCQKEKLNHRFGKKEDSKHKEMRLKKVFRALKLTPNKPERLLNKLLQKLLPSEYKFVGDGKVILGGLCPDFINCNGQKKIIELYGDYWHNLKSWKERDKKRVPAYKKYGYQTLIIWEHELKDLDKVKNRILTFNNVGAK